MKRILTMAVLILLAACFCAGTAHAQPGGRGGPPPGGGPGPGPGPGMPMMKWWLQSDVVKELGLSKEQVEKIDAVSKKGRRDDVKLRSKVELIGLDLDDAMDEPKIDPKKVGALIDKFVEANADLERQKMLTLLKIREILTQDQHLKLKEFFGRKMAEHFHQRDKGKK